MQDDASRAAFIMSQVVCAQAEIAGMQAENTIRALIDEVPAYGMEAFEDVINRHDLHHNSVVMFLNNGR